MENSYGIEIVKKIENTGFGHQAGLVNNNSKTNLYNVPFAWDIEDNLNNLKKLTPALKESEEGLKSPTIEPMNNHQDVIKPLDPEWIVGFTDGEGSVHLTRKKMPRGKTAQEKWVQ